MAIKKVQNELEKNTPPEPTAAPATVAEAPAQQEDKTDPAPQSATDRAEEQAERVLMAMHTTPQPYLTRCTFKLSATIPTGDYQNLTPQIEVEYVVPEGAMPPDNIDVMNSLSMDIAAFVVPQATQQTNIINTRTVYEAALKAGKTEDLIVLDIAAAFSAGSPLFRWLTTFDRPAARRIVRARINSYKDNE